MTLTLSLIVNFICVCVSIRKNYLELRIFFEELSYSRVAQKAAYPFASLISK